MERTRSAWLRGAVTVGVAGTLAAISFIAPVGAVKESKEASKKFVKTQVGVVQTEVDTLQAAALANSRWVVQEFSATPGNASHESTVNCPAGTRALAGGVDSPGVLENLWLNESGPVINGSNLGVTGPGTYPAATGWHAQVYNDTAAPLTYRIGVLCSEPTP